MMAGIIILQVAVEAINAIRTTTLSVVKVTGASIATIRLADQTNSATTRTHLSVISRAADNVDSIPGILSSAARHPREAGKPVTVIGEVNAGGRRLAATCHLLFPLFPPHEKQKKFRASNAIRRNKI
jgi:hypothetical protein